MYSFKALLLFSFVAAAICQETPFGFTTEFNRTGPNRNINVISAPGSFGIRAVAVSKVGNMTDLDAVRAGATLVPFPTMTYSYFTSYRNVTEDITDFASAHFSFAFRFVGIIEYAESGATDGFQPSGTSNDTNIMTRHALKRLSTIFDLEYEIIWYFESLQKIRSEI